MNNIAMWEAHIRGKRHMKNIKKAPRGTVPTNKYIEAPPGTFSDLQKQLEECDPNEIIVGLDYIKESQGKHGNQYNCFLCGGCSSDIDIIHHIRSFKHKIKYLEKIHADGFKNSIEEINSLEMSNNYKAEIVNEECRNMMLKYGSGNPQVYFLKSV